MPAIIITLSATAAYLIGTIGGGIIGNRADGYFCKAVNNVYKSLFKNKDRPENHDILKAVRRACLNASLDACKYVEKKYNLLNNLSSRGPSNLKEVKKYLTDQIKEVENLNFKSDYTQLASNNELFLAPKKVTTKERLVEIGAIQKEKVIEELKNAHLFWVEIDLQNAILDGWNENGVKIDWWQDLVCGYFAEEYKTNNRLSKIIEAEYLIDIKNSVGEIIASQHSFQESIDSLYISHQEIKKLLEFIPEIAEDVKENLKLTKEINTTLKKLNVEFRIQDIEEYKQRQQTIADLKAEEIEFKLDIVETENLTDNQENDSSQRILSRLKTGLFELNKKRSQEENSLREFEKNILIAAKFLKENSPKSKRFKKASDLFYKGKFDKMLEVLNDDEISTDIKESKEDLRDLAKELLFKAQAIQAIRPNQSFEEVKKYYEQAINTHQSFDTCLLYAHFLSKYHFNSKALKYYQYAFSDTSAENPENSYKIFRSFGEHLMNIGDYEQAESYLRSAFNALKNIDSETNSKENMASLYLNIGLAVREQRKYELSIAEFNEALIIYEDLRKGDDGFDLLLAKTYSDLAGAVSNLPSDEISIRVNESNLTNNERIIADQVSKNLSFDEKITDKRTLAQEYYEKSIEIFRNVSSQPKEKWLMYFFDTVYSFANFHKNMNDAEPYLTEALLIAEELFEINAPIYLKDLAKTQHRMFDLKMALKNMEEAQENLLKATASYYHLIEIDPNTFGEPYAKSFMDLALFNLTQKEISKETNELARKYSRTALRYFDSKKGEKIAYVKRHIKQCKDIIKETILRDYNIDEKNNDG